LALRAGKDEITAAVDERAIVERVHAAVMERRLPPGAKLSEAAICDSFGVGRMRARRSLLLLASQGIVELHSNRGAFVAAPSMDDAREVFAARMAIEPSVVGLAVAAADAASIRAAETLLAQEHAAQIGNRRQDAIRLSGQFHVQLARMSGNAILERIVKELVTRSSLIVGLYGDDNAASCPNDEHGDILKAIRAGRSDHAKHLIAEHLRHIEKGLKLSARNAENLDVRSILSQPPV
jgi:DNA-binding GntR family transcriptional regulator